MACFYKFHVYFSFQGDRPTEPSGDPVPPDARRMGVHVGVPDS